VILHFDPAGVLLCVDVLLADDDVGFADWRYSLPPLPRDQLFFSRPRRCSFLPLNLPPSEFLFFSGRMYFGKPCTEYRIEAPGYNNICTQQMADKMTEFLSMNASGLAL